MAGEQTDGELFLHYQQLKVLALDLADYLEKRRATQPDFKLAWLARPLLRRCRAKRFDISRGDVAQVMHMAAEELKAASRTARTPW